MTSPAVFVTPPVYFGDIGWWSHAVKHPIISLACGGKYQRQTPMTRMFIAGPNGKLRISLQVAKPVDGLLAHANLSYAEKWPLLHVRSLRTAYNCSPYYTHYADRIEQHILSGQSSLTTFLAESVQLMAKLLKADVHVEVNVETAGPVLMEVDKIWPPYRQVFDEKTGFIPNLSVLDLLFNCGPDSLNYLLKNSIETY